MVLCVNLAWLQAPVTEPNADLGVVMTASVNWLTPTMCHHPRRCASASVRQSKISRAVTEVSWRSGSASGRQQPLLPGRWPASLLRMCRPCLSPHHVGQSPQMSHLEPLYLCLLEGLLLGSTLTDTDGETTVPILRVEPLTLPVYAGFWQG